MKNKKILITVGLVVVSLLAALLFCLGGEKVPAGTEALIYRFWEGIEKDDYTQWKYFYDKNCRAQKDDTGILPCMDGDESREYWTSSYLHWIHREMEQQYGKGFEVSYTMNSWERELEDWELIEFSQWLIDKYGLSLGVEYFPGMSDLYQESVEEAYIYNIDIEIRDSQGNCINWDDCEYIVYYTDNHWMIEGAAFQ